MTNTAVEQKAKAIDRASYTNLLLADLLVTLEKLIDIATEGQLDALDHNCQKLFTETEKKARDLLLKSKEEVANHVRQDCWG